MKTLLQNEIEQQDCWRLRPQFKSLGRLFKSIIQSEFTEPKELELRQQKNLSGLLKYCSEVVPYYKDLFAELKFDPNSVRQFSDLAALPVLERHVVQGQAKRLQTKKLPKGFVITGPTRTSGTSGQPVEVLQTQEYARTFGLMKLREYRWFRYEPSRKLSSIRNPGDLPGIDGELIQPNQTFLRETWPSVGYWFKTGPWVGLSETTPVEQQIAWLEEQRPAYLLAQSAPIEHLALAMQGEKLFDGFSGIEVISQQLTEDMRHRVETTFQVPVHQNYGLNEAGIVAARCPEGGRYHVHNEFYSIEIVDQNGRQVRAGETGRLLLTVYNNPAMPLIRYDTDDLAEAVEGPCPCGRTLPSFKNLHGRFRRTILCPPDTQSYWYAILHVISDADQALTEGLRQYQFHQYLDETYELRLVAVKKLPDKFEQALRASWNKAVDDEAPKLTVKYVDVIERPEGGKFQNFTSDFTNQEQTGEGRE